MPKHAVSWKHPVYQIYLFWPDSARGRAKTYYRISLPDQPRVEGRLADQFSYSDRHFEALTKEWEFAELRDRIATRGHPGPEVMSFAERLYFRLREQVGRGKALNTVKIPTVQVAAERFMISLNRDLLNGRISQDRHKHHRVFLNRFVIPYEPFFKLTVDEVTEDHLTRWQHWRTTYWFEGPGKEVHEIPYYRGDTRLIRKIRPEERKPPTLATKARDQSQFNSLFNFCVAQGWIKKSQIPRYSIQNTRVSPPKKRPAFTREQWDRLDKFVHDGWLDPPKLFGDSRRSRQILWWFCTIVRAYGLRVSEGYSLTFGSLRPTVLDNGERTLMLHVPPIKFAGHERVVEPIFRFIPEVLRIAETLPGFYEKHYGFRPEPHESLWLNRNRTAITTFYVGFESLLKKAGVEKDAQGNLYSLGSLRHSAITEEIETTTLNPHIIADWAGTSMKMIQNHYGQPLTSRVRRAEYDHRRKLLEAGDTD